MILLPEAAMANLRRVAGTGFMDTCQVLTFTPGNGDYGSGTGQATYADGASEACLFRPRPAGDAQGESEVEMVDADLYLARSSTLGANDRVTITHLHGDAVASPQTFAIVGGPVLGKTLVHAKLKLVTDGSN